MPDKPSLWPSRLALALLVAVAFWPALSGGFVYDDALYVSGPPEIRAGLSLRSIAWAFTSMGGGIWYPATRLSHLLDATLFGMSPAPHHLANLAWHVLATWALLGLVRALGGSVGAAFAVAAIHALHPLRVEPVAWITSRKDLLSGLFFFWAVAAYLRRCPRWHVLVLAAACLLAKPAFVALPLVFLLLDYWPHRRSESLPRLVFEKLPFTVLALLAGIVAGIGQKSAAAVVASPLLERVQVALLALGAYLTHIVWPFRFAVFYPYPTSVSRIGVAAAALAVALLFLGAWLARRRAPELVVGWGWFLLTLAPVLGLVRFGGHFIADRFLYVPLAGLTAGLVLAAERWLAPWPKARTMLVVALLLALLVRARAESGYWRSEETLWARALEVTPENAVAHVALSSIRGQQGRPDEAANHAREAVRISPDYARGHHNLGVAAATLGRLDEARAAFRREAELAPASADPWFQLGNLEASSGRAPEARAAFERAVTADPRHDASHFNLGVLAAQAGRTDEAIERFRRVLELVPTSIPAHANLGALLVDAGRADEAIDILTVGVRLAPGDARMHLHLGRALQLAGRADEAAGELAEARRLEPGL